MIPPALEQQAHDAWDRGVDPLDSVEVQAWLQDHPEDIESFAAWRASVATLVSIEDVTSSRSRRPLVAGLAAAVLLAGIAVLQADDPVVPPPPEPGVRRWSTTEATSPHHTIFWSERRTLVSSPATQLTITEHRSARR